VNGSKKKFTKDQRWVVFFEKFGTTNRITVSTTCFINSMPLLLFGGPVVVKHTERKVIVDDWMEIEMAAQVGVLLRQLREQLIGPDGLLHKMIVQQDGGGTYSNDAMISSVVDILSSPTR
jgi:ATP-dependent RNA helicase DHX29